MLPIIFRRNQRNMSLFTVVSLGFGCWVSLCCSVAVYLIGLLSNRTCLWGLAEEVWCAMWSKIVTTGCSRFIILIKGSDFPSVPLLPSGRWTADDIPYKEGNIEIFTAVDKRRFVTLDSTFQAVDTLVATPTIPFNIRLATHSPQIPSPHYQQRLKKIYFMYYKVREPTGNERAPVWKTNKEKGGRKISGREKNPLSISRRYWERDIFLSSFIRMCVA